MNKIEKVMREHKHGTLHSGSKHGPKVKNRKQAIAIALSEARKAGEHVKPTPYSKVAHYQAQPHLVVSSKNLIGKRPADHAQMRHTHS